MLTMGSLPVLTFICLVSALWSLGHGQQVGYGYRLVSVDQGSDGSLIGSLELIQHTNTYGPDIPHLRLYVKYGFGSIAFFHWAAIFFWFQSDFILHCVIWIGFCSIFCFGFDGF